MCIGSQSDLSSSKNNLSFKLASNVKKEPSDELYTQSQQSRDCDNDALYSFNNRTNNYNKGYNSQRNSNSRWQSQTSNRYSRPSYSGTSASNINPLDKFGRPLMCDFCHCICHLFAKCPYVSKVNFCEEGASSSYQHDIDPSDFDNQQHF